MKDLEWTEEEMRKLEENLGRLGTPEERRASVDAIARAGVRLYFERLRNQVGQIRFMPAGLYPDAARPMRTAGPHMDRLEATTQVLEMVEAGSCSHVRGRALLEGVLGIQGEEALRLVQDATAVKFERETISIKKYVVGFVFDLRMEHGGSKQAPPTMVLLIRKAKPAWQAGHLNGIGGKVEAGETFPQAMAREAREESTGPSASNLIDVSAESWRHFATLTGSEVYNPSASLPAGVREEFEIAMFCTFVDGVVMERAAIATAINQEPLVLLSLERALTTDERVLPNISWLIGMALGKLRGESAERFVVCEVGAKPRGDKARAEAE